MKILTRFSQIRLEMWAIAALVICSPSLADKIFVDASKGAGIEASQLETLRELIKTAVEELKTHQLQNEADQSDYTLTPSLLRLGDAYIVKLEKTHNGKSLFSSQLKAAHIEELDKVAQRLTRSVIAETSASGDPRVGEITDNEAVDGTQRRATRRFFYLGFGGGSLAKLNSSGVGVNLEMAKVWDLNVASIRLFLNTTIKGSAYLGQTGLGINFFFSKSDIAPFISGDLGYGISKAQGIGILDGETAGGFMMGAGGGVQFFRSSSVNVEVGLRGGFLLTDTLLGHPSTIMFRLGVNL